MVTQEQLAALDFLIWLKTSEQAAQLAFSDQSTICRRTQTVLRQFGLKLERGPSGRRPAGDLELLDLERQVHQQARFRGHHPLRLHVPYWTRREALRDLPEGWCANPLVPGLVCDDPVTLLREHILDACLVTPTQLPACQDDLVLLELYERPIQLILFPRSQEHPADVRDRFWWQRENGHLDLRLLPFLPESCRQRSSDWFKALDASSGDSPGTLRRLEPSRYAGESLTVAFLTPEMRAAQDWPSLVEDTVQPYPYVERLAVLADHAAEPAVLRLQEQLMARFAPQALRVA
jgi:hypothetical protein